MAEQSWPSSISKAFVCQSKLDRKYVHTGTCQIEMSLQKPRHMSNMVQGRKYPHLHHSSHRHIHPLPYKSPQKHPTYASLPTFYFPPLCRYGHTSFDHAARVTIRSVHQLYDTSSQIISIAILRNHLRHYRLHQSLIATSSAIYHTGTQSYTDRQMQCMADTKRLLPASRLIALPSRAFYGVTYI